MSSIKIVCPPALEIQDITIPTCFEDFGQIQRASFQRIYSAVGVKNTFVTATNDIKLKASWDAFIAAADSTKIQVTPDLENPTYEPGAARTTGGGNATLGGINKKIGTEVTTGEFYLNAYKQSTIAQMKAYMQERNIGIYYFNEHGQIGCIADDPESPTEFYPIPIAPRTLFIGDKRFGGLEEEDRNMLMLEHFANWSDKFVIVNPTDFNPLVDLVN